MDTELPFGRGQSSYYIGNLCSHRGRAQSCSAITSRSTATAAATSSAVCPVRASRRRHGDAVLASGRLQATSTLRRQPHHRPARVGRVGGPRDQALLLQLARRPRTPSAATSGRPRRGRSCLAGPSSSRRDRIRMPAGCPTRRRTARTSRAAYTTISLLCSSRSVGIRAGYRGRRWTSSGRNGRMARMPTYIAFLRAVNVGKRMFAQGRDRAGLRGRRLHRRRDLHQHRQRRGSPPACGAGRRSRGRWRRRSQRRLGSRCRRSCSRRRS